MIEVEIKFPLRDAKIEGKLKKLGARLFESERQDDAYFLAPDRDFSRTDEALRLRLASGKKGASITYKGPKIDAQSKTRKEIKVNVDDAESAKEILLLLGYREAKKVVKDRKKYRKGGFIISVDKVHGLGNFIEIEAHGKEKRDVPRLREGAFKIAENLGLKRSDSTRVSYLEMLIEKGR